jgi:rhomboid protease GluP
MDFLASKVTTILIIINIGIFLLETKDGGSTNRDVALKYGAQYQPLIRQGQYYRLFTAMFLHFGVYHLLFNMYALSAINLIYGLSSKRINMMSHAGGFVGGAAIMAVIMAVR